MPHWTTFSRYFAATLAETYPNRIYQHAGQTDRLHNTTAISHAADDLGPPGRRRADAAATTTATCPSLRCGARSTSPISRPVTTFFADCAAGTLPHVTFVDPRFEDEDSGTSGDDHPHADIRNGEAFMNSIYRAVTTSPTWSRTVLIINFDEWGGFYDHVAPPPRADPAADAAAGNQDGLRGFRVPCLIVSPLARRGHIATASTTTPRSCA